MIETAGLTKRYANVVAVEDLSLHVARGELLVLLGGSGSGKTTTLKMVNRLIEPSAGRVTIDGQDTRTLDAHELRRRIGYVFQRVGLFPHLTVAENVAVTLALLGWDGRASRIASTSCWSWSSSRRRVCASGGPRSCRAASSSASGSRARSPRAAA